MPEDVRVEPISGEQLEGLLPLIAAYQRFYEVDVVDDGRNRAFFSRFLAPSDDGMLLGAWRDGELVGYACLYWHFTSLVPAETVLMNDLYVVERRRGRGIGRALIEASAAVARERGAHRLEWATQPSNLTAQRLYDRTGAERSEWVEYELDVVPKQVVPLKLVEASRRRAMAEGTVLAPVVVAIKPTGKLTRSLR